MADSVFEPGKRGRGRRGGVVVAYLTGFSSLFDFSHQIKEDQAPGPSLRSATGIQNWRRDWHNFPGRCTWNRQCFKVLTRFAKGATRRFALRKSFVSVKLVLRFLNSSSMKFSWSMVTFIFYDLSGRNGGVTDGIMTPCIFLWDSNIDVYKTDFCHCYLYMNLNYAFPEHILNI